MNKLHLSFFGFFIFLFFPLSSLAATLSLSAPASSYKVGDTFTVTVGLNASASEQVVGVDIPALTFDATKLQVQGSQVTINSLALGPANKASTTVNSVNNNTGTITLGMQYWADLANNPSFASGNVALATISFRVTNTGSVTISTGSQALVASYSGTNVLTGGPATLALTLNPATVLDTQAPTVSITAPTAGAIVSGSAFNLSATASDNIGVVGVRFRVDGVDITPEDTTPPSPFSVSWNTTALANGSSHIITAVARDAAGNTTTSAGITVYVNNSTSNKFVVGDQVQMNAGGINVRSTPGGTSLGTQTINTIGTVVSDATYSNPTYALLNAAGYFWWKVNFDTGFDGWVAEQYLTKYVSPTFDFSLSSGGSPSVTAGSSVNNAIIVNTLAGSPQLVGTFSSSGLPSGATASFSPLSCVPSGAPSSCQTTMTINSGTAAPVANKAVTVSAVSGSLTKTVTFNLTINAQADIQAPTAPSNVSATAVSSNQVNLSWTGSTDDIGVMGYRIYKDGVVLPQTTTGTTYQVTGLSGNTAYSFQIEAYDASGKATRSLVKTVTTPAAPDTQAPTVSITNLTSGQSVSGTINISANASDTGGSGMAGVQFAIDGQSIGARDTLTPYSASWNSASVPNGSHQITATAYDAANNSAPASVSVSVNNVLADTAGPVISNIAESAVTASGATASFNTDEPATYIIRYWVSGVNTLSFLSDITTQRTSHNAVFSGLLPDTFYQYDILARDQAGNQTQSSVRSFKTAVLTVPDTTPPSAITNLALANRSARSATVSWSAPLDTGGSQNSGKTASYILAYAGFNLSSANWANARFAGGLPSPAAPGVTETYTLVDLSPNTAYSIAIKSKDGAGLESPISNVISVTTSADNTSGNSGNGGGGGGGGQAGDNIPPGQVRDPKVKEFDKQISVSWQNPADSDFIRTVVVRKEGNAPSSRTDGLKIYEAGGASFNDLNLENGKEYFYALFAVDSSSNYSEAKIISARPKAGATQASETNAGATNTIPAGNQGTNTSSNNSLSPVAGPFSVGMRSEEVKVLQQILATDPSIYPEGVINGYYGPATVEAVKKFQAQYMGITNGSPTTNGYGLAGPSTRAKLNEVFVFGKTTESVGSGANTPPVTTGGNVATSGLIVKGPFSIGIRSEEVKVLQRVLAGDSTVYPEGKVTGFYGPATTEAVKRFQNKYMGITSGAPSTNGYGLAGPSTRAKLNEVFGGGAGQTSNLTPEQKAALIEELKKQIAELTQKIADLIAAQQAGVN